MDDKLNPTLVGAFVLLLGAALVFGVLWLSAGIGGQRATDRYQAVIGESVSGLNVDAPVKYLGVNVGKVTRIEIDPTNSQRVRLQFVIHRGTPIQRDSLAVLRTQGLTGIAYVEISGGSAGSPPLHSGAEDEVPTIAFEPSLSARLENVLSTVLANIDRTSANINALFDADNRAAVKATLADVAALSAALAGQKDTLAAAIADAARTASLAAEAGAQLAPALTRVDRAALAVERMAGSADAAAAAAADAAQRVGLAADAGVTGVQQLRTETLPELGRLMAELQQLSASVRRLSEQTTASPASLLTGGPAPQPGPGERASP